MTLVEHSTIINGTRGQTICTDATWIDVGKFITLNYITHAFTVLQQPGSSPIQTIIWVLSSLFMPFLGIVRPLSVILRFVIFRQFSPLKMAANAGALRMIVGIGRDRIIRVPTALAGMEENPNSQERECSYGWFDDNAIAHGKNPVGRPRGLFTGPQPQHADDEEDHWDPTYYRFVRLPPEFRYSVSEIGDSRDSMQIASQYNVVQGLAAVAQICFASKALYDARGRQIERFGYAAFGMTVLPYIWMSFLNLVGAIFEPHYSYSYIVYYRGSMDPDHIERSEDQKALDERFEAKIVGAVGVVHGDPDCFQNVYQITSMISLSRVFSGGGSTPQTRLYRFVGVIVAWCLSLAVPYTVIYVMTGFEKSESTPAQRFSVVGWIAIGQVMVGIGILLQFLFGLMAYNLYMMAVIIFISMPVGIGSVVVVSQMILEYGVCTRI
ncbi:hypothetical protein K440DRAFT_670643 [Wilcoxina mikolae CBS 423.85]|nr:hypothetical protein K440DRAFT_670643 [Wilcoxina mikolae CBS 423.85]